MASPLLPSIPPAPLGRSPLQPGLLERPALIDRLNRGASRRMTLLTAPAGSGKTTLLTQWANQLDRQTSWIALGEATAELGPFVMALLSALLTIQPVAGRTTLHLLHSPDHPSPTRVALALCRELESAPTAGVLILDNYEHVLDPAALEFTGVLINNLPAAQHIVLSCRADPPLALARLRTFDQISQFRARDLYFTPEESEAFLRNLPHQQLSDEDIQDIIAQSQGWPAGLRLVTLSLATTSPADRVRIPLGRSRMVMDYFLEEVLAQTSPQVVGLLLRSSILEAMSPPLVSAVTHTPLATAAWLLDYLERSGLFTTALPDRDGWYGFHPMLRDTLRRRLELSESTEAIARLHTRAAAWCAANGLVDDAIRHSLLAGNLEQACQLAEAALLTSLSREDFLQMENQLALLPKEAVQQRPLLLIIQARLIGARSGWTAAQPWIESAQRVLDEAGPSIAAEARKLTEGLIHTMRAPIHFYAGQPEATLRHAERVLDTQWGVNPYAFGWATVFAGVSHALLGRPRRAQEVVERAFEAGQAPGQSSIASFALFGMTTIHLLAGRLAESERAAKAMLALETSVGREFGVAWASYFLGVLAYEANRLVEAGEHFDRVLALRLSGSLLALREAMLGAALVQAARGEREAARLRLDEAEHYLLETDNVAFLPTLHSVRARVALIQGDVDTARTWLDVTPSRFDPGPMIFLEIPPLTRAAALLAVPGRPAAEAAGPLLQEVEGRGRAQHTLRFQVSVRALQALALARAGRPAAAHASLSEALDLGRAGGYVRAFRDYGPGLIGLLRATRTTPAHSAYLGRLLSAGGPPVDLPVEPPVPSEPLTPRELEMLPMLQRRLTNEEIAQSMGISILTVKRHAGNLYAKLGVKGRREAVQRAIALGLLPPQA